MLQGFREADSSSWGGSIVYSEQDSMYHMYPSRMAGHCGLNAWFANSAIVHAVSDTPLGPYTYSSTVIQPFAHEGSTYMVPGGRGGPGAGGDAGSERMVMVHSGCGNATVAFVHNCSNGTTHQRVPKFHTTRCDQYHVQLGTAASPGAPWSAVLDAGPLRVMWDGSPVPVVSNPGLSFGLQRGAAAGGGSDQPVLMVFKACGKGVVWPCTMHLGIARAPRPNSTVWEVVVPPGAIPFTGKGAEDPYLWRDARGSWHILYHGYDEDGVATGCGGHAFSPDLAHWYDGKEPAYTLTLEFDNGTTQAVARRERPQLVVGKDGTPLYLSNGVQPDASADYTFTLVVAINQAGSGDPLRVA